MTRKRPAARNISDTSRTGFNEFKKWALKDVSLPDLAELEERIYWSGIKY